MTTENTARDDLKVELWNVADLVPYDKNAKRHPPEQVRILANAIREFGWRKGEAIEVCPHTGTIINGHGRRLAALDVGLKKVPVVVRNDLTLEQVKAYRLIDNKTADSSYDTDAIAEELAGLMTTEGFDLEMTMFFSEKELNMAMGDLDDMDMDALVDDIGSEVDRMGAETEQRISNESATRVKLTRIFGFADVSAADERAFRSLITMAEGYTGLEGREALVTFLKNDFLEMAKRYDNFAPGQVTS